MVCIVYGIKSQMFCALEWSILSLQHSLVNTIRGFVNLFTQRPLELAAQRSILIVMCVHGNHYKQVGCSREGKRDRDKRWGWWGLWFTLRNKTHLCVCELLTFGIFWTNSFQYIHSTYFILVPLHYVSFSLVGFSGMVTWGWGLLTQDSLTQSTHSLTSSFQRWFPYRYISLTTDLLCSCCHGRIVNLAL